VRSARSPSLVAAFPVPPPAHRRAEVEAAIETALDTVHRLIAYLDTLDGDADLEPEEPEAAAREWCGAGAHRFDVGAAA
jgi:hypothetical protein